jgi:hypothetical protein
MEETPSRGQVATIGTCAALVTLARLDHVLLVAPAIVLSALRVARAHTNTSNRVRRLLILGTCACGPVVLYMLLNRAWLGSYFPVSGNVKSTFPFLLLDKPAIAAQLVETAVEPPPLWLPRLWRLAQICVPALAALIYLWVMARRGALTLRDFGAPLALGVLVLAGYDFWFVPAILQGHWYFPVSLPAVTLLFVLAHAGSPGASRAGTSAAPVAPVVAAVALCVVVFLAVHRSPTYHEGFRAFHYEEAPKVRARFAKVSPRFFAIDDGNISFSTGFPAMASEGLMIDAAALPATRAGRLGDLAVERGYDHFTIFAYSDFREATDANGRPSPAFFLSRFGGKLADPSAYAVSLVYLADDRSFGVFKVRKR